MENLPAAAALGKQPSSRMSACSISSAEPLLPGGGGCARYLYVKRNGNAGRNMTKGGHGRDIGGNMTDQKKNKFFG